MMYYNILFSFAAAAAATLLNSCNQRAGRLHVHEFNVISRQLHEVCEPSLKKDLNDLVDGIACFDDASIMCTVCSHGDIADIQKITPLRALYEKLSDSEKKELLGALKRNVYYTQNKKGGNYSCDQLFAEILKKDLNIIVYKDKPNHPSIFFKNYLTQQFLGGYGLHLDNEADNFDLLLYHIRKSYVSALANLVVYFRGEKSKFYKTNKKDLKASFLSLIEVVGRQNEHNYNDHFQNNLALSKKLAQTKKLPDLDNLLKGFVDMESSALASDKGYSFALLKQYTKIIRTIDPEILNAIQQSTVFTQSIPFAVMMTQFFTAVNNTTEAKKFLKITQDLIKVQEQSGLSDLDHMLINSKQACCVEGWMYRHTWHRGVICMGEKDYKQAEPIFTKLYEDIQSNKNFNSEEHAELYKHCISNLYSVYLHRGNYRKADMLWEKHKALFPSCDIVTKMVSESKYPSWEDIKHLPYEERSTTLIQAFHYSDDQIQRNRYKEHIKTHVIDEKELFSKLSFDSQIYVKLLYDPNALHHSATKTFFKKNNSSEKDLLVGLSLTYAALAQYEVAKKFIDQAIKSHTDGYLCAIKETIDHALQVEVAAQQRIANLSLSTTKIEEPLPTSSLLQEKKMKIKTRPSSDDDYDHETILEGRDPQKIHRYFQRLSKKEIKHNILHQADKNFGWFMDNQKIAIDFAQVKQISLRCFAVIHPDLKAKLGSDLSMWEGCLDKGYARSKESCSGIKYLKEKDIYELKYTATGDRLVATVIYTNEQGNKLILFDHLATHKEIERMSDCARLQHIICSNWDA